MNGRHASTIELGNAVRSARKELGISQDVLAATAGVGARFVVELEAGKQTVQLDKVLCVLDVLGIELRFTRPSSRNAHRNAMPCSMISIPVDATLESQAAVVLNRIGVSAETAVRLLFAHLAERGTLPDSLKVPNLATQKALADADTMMAQRRRATSPMSASEVEMSDGHVNGEENGDAYDGGHK